MEQASASSNSDALRKDREKLAKLLQEIKKSGVLDKKRIQGDHGDAKSQEGNLKLNNAGQEKDAALLKGGDETREKKGLEESDTSNLAPEWEELIRRYKERLAENEKQWK